MFFSQQNSFVGIRQVGQELVECKWQSNREQQSKTVQRSVVGALSLDQFSPLQLHVLRLDMEQDDECVLLMANENNAPYLSTGKCRRQRTIKLLEKIFVKLTDAKEIERMYRTANILATLRNKEPLTL